MSNLYIRVMTGFYSHRKTARLRSAIGDDAFWIPPRLWAYCAENQPDGNISSYSSEELAMLIGCVKHSSSILEALKSSGFIDHDGIVHDWDAYNGYHKRYSERAKAAADARWSKKKEAKKKDIGHRTVDSGDKHCLTHACSMLVASSPLEIPEKLRTPNFEAAWIAWMEYRNKLKKPKDPHAMFSEQLNWLSDYPPSVAIEILNSSIRNGYQGLFEPRNGGPNKPGIDRNAGTANEGKSSQYAGVGKVV